MKARIVLGCLNVFCAGVMFGECVDSHDRPLRLVVSLAFTLACGVSGIWALRR
jgi:hypothetical protein